jgi:hypothetical protein
MRFRNYFPAFKDEGEVIASWGEAQLIKYPDGKLELKGGAPSTQRLVEAPGGGEECAPVASAASKFLRASA